MNRLKEKDLSEVVERAQVLEEHCWNVGKLYVDPEKWKEELSEIKPLWPKFKKYQGHLGDPSMVKELFDLYFEVDRKLAKLHTYAHLRLDEDLGNDQYKHNFGLISSLMHDYQLEVSWIEPELLGLPEERFEAVCQSPKLEPFRFYLEKLKRMRPHTLSPEIEEVLAMSGKALDTSYLTFAALNNADLTFEDAIDSKGGRNPLTTGSYLSYLKSSDRALRKSAFQNLHKSYQAHGNTFCELMQGQVQGHAYMAKARKFQSCLESALFPHNIDKGVYNRLVETIREHLGLMHEYISLRKKLLNLNEIHPYDLQVPIVQESQREIPYEEACQLVIDSVLPLGKAYQDELRKGLLEDRWVDIYENARKRSGAYSSGCYDSFPYILMNYHGSLNDVLTLAHEAGHSMHSLLSRNGQSYIYSQYPIFVAEVASTFNEKLLLELLKKRAKSKRELAYLINYEIEGIRGTIFRQALFAEFEKKVHEWVEEGIPLTPALLKKHYLALNRDYYGKEMQLGPEVEIEWARIPHFYYNFYVYQYATGLSAALTLFDKVKGSEENREKYLEFLSSGGSRFPLDLLRRAGVDMEQKEAVDRAMKHFKELIKALREALDL